MDLACGIGENGFFLAEVVPSKRFRPQPVGVAAGDGQRTLQLSTGLRSLSRPTQQACPPPPCERPVRAAGANTGPRARRKNRPDGGRIAKTVRPKYTQILRCEVAK